jgi:hypothetical protein
MVAASGTRTAEPEVTYVASWLEPEILKPVVRIALARKLLVRLNAKARASRAEYANAT